MAKEVGHNSREVGPVAGDLSRNHKQVGARKKGNPISFILGPGSSGESAKKGGELWAC
jgi:hypothetical protein